MIHICPNCSNRFEETPQATEPLKSKAALSIINLCVQHFQVTEGQLFSKSREKRVAAARHTAMYFISKYGSNITDGDVTRLFNRNRTQAISARQRCHNAYFTKGDIYKDLVELEPMIEAIAFPLLKAV
jgi:chromosomal replication initiation ATPase DnaA